MTQAVFFEIFRQWQEWREDSFKGRINAETGQLAHVVAQVLRSVVGQKEDFLLLPITLNEGNRPRNGTVTEVNRPIKVKSKTRFGKNVHFRSGWVKA